MSDVTTTDTETALGERGAEVLARIGNMTVQTVADYVAAGTELVKLVGYIKEVEAFFDPEIEALEKPYKLAVANVKKYIAPFSEAEAMLRKQLAESDARRIARDTAAREAGAVVPVSDPPKVPGLTHVRGWKGECFDKAALIQAVAAGEAPEDLIEVNTSKLNEYARSQREALCYPGTKAVRTSSTRVNP